MGISLTGREFGLKKLMAVNLLKRLESSIHSFQITTGKVLDRINKTIKYIDNYNNHDNCDLINENDYTDLDDNLFDILSDGGNYQLNFKDMDYKSWHLKLLEDKVVLDNLHRLVKEITPECDKKLQTILDEIANKINNPINSGNKKILIFTAFADTAEYLYEHISKYAIEKFQLNTALITGSSHGKSTVKKMPTDFNTVLTCFSPISKDHDKLNQIPDGDIDILIGTDCISEGQNLQDCDYLINFDIHWNPVRIIQRFGRIDRIGSKNNNIQLVNFWPNIKLDEYINLRNRVETRMKITIMTSTGEENPIDTTEKGDLEYRKKQLEKLQKEIVDPEDISGGVTIMDLGLNEFRLDLIEYRKLHHDIDKTPFGMHAVARADGELSRGVIFILKNIENAKNIGNPNRLHPFYMVYLAEDGEVICNHLEPKSMLDNMRFLCKGKNKVEDILTKEFNQDTRDGNDMKHYSQLLQTSIQSIINIKEEKEIDSLFSDGGTNILSGGNYQGTY